MHYHFEWDPTKDRANVRKHKVSFRRAAAIFRDPNQLAIYDQEHSEQEDRWITMGIDSGGVLLIVVHTFEYVEPDLCQIRIISARKTVHAEARQYEERAIP